MTETQALICQRRQARLERRQERIEQERRELRETILGIVALIFLLMAFIWAGTMDYQDEQREIAYWESQGIHIVRDW